MLARSRRTSPDASIRRLPIFVSAWIITDRLGQLEGYLDSGPWARARLITVKVKLHYAYKVRNIGRVRPILRYCVF